MKLKYGFVTVEVFEEHHEVVIIRKPLGSEETNHEKVFLSTKAFAHLSRQFLKKWKPKHRKAG